MKKLLTLIFCLAFVSPLFTQSCSNCTKFIGDQSHGFKQLLLTINSPTAADSTQPEIPAAAWTCGGSACYTRSLFKFDLSSIPTGATITSANLFLYATTNNLNGQTGNPMFGTANASVLERVNTNWTVANTGWNNQPTSTAVSEKVLPQSAATVQNYVVGVTDFVQFWVSKPDSNYGMMLKLKTEQAYNSMIFQSGQAPDDSLKPRLEICYSMPGSLRLTISGEATGNTFKQLLLASNHGTTADSSQPEIPATAWTCNGARCNTRGLFKFSINSIPDNATVNSAKLYLFAKPGNLNGQTGNPMFGSANTSDLKRVTAPWSTATTAWNNQPAATSINQKVLPQSTSNVQDYIVDVTDFTQLWVNRPDSNFGVILQLANEQSYNSMIFYSGTAPQDALKPRLEVCYTLNNVLPLSIADFAVAGSSRANVLRFTVMNQQDLSKIEIERSLNGTGFSTINILSPTNPDNASFYQITDLDIKDFEKIHYRLKLVKKDGKVEYSKILVVGRSGKVNNFQVYPNPAHDEVQVSFNSRLDTDAVVKVQDISGRLISEQNVILKRGSNSISLPIHQLRPGTYLITMTVNKEVLQQKLLVQ